VLTLVELRTHLARLTYRPGWALRIVDGTWEGPELHIAATVADSYHPDADVELDIRTFLPPQVDTEAFERWLGWRLGRIESHEMREWLKRDGRPIFDPHAQEATP
jgi:hypothetical protein